MTCLGARTSPGRPGAPLLVLQTPSSELLPCCELTPYPWKLTKVVPGEEAGLAREQGLLQCLSQYYHGGWLHRRRSLGCEDFPLSLCSSDFLGSKLVTGSARQLRR